MTTTTIDCDYTGRPGIAASYLIREGDQLAVVETNTNAAVSTILQAVGAQGLTPEDVRYVIITHIHLDHAGGAGLLMSKCPNATLLAHPRAAPHAVDPSRIIEGASKVYGADVFSALYGEILPVPEQRVRIMGDDETLSFGSRTWRFLHTAGHAKHHFCLFDASSGGVFTGDSYGIVYPHLQRGGMLTFPSTSPTDFDADAAHASIDRIAETGARWVFPTHFGRHGDLETMRSQLHRGIDAHEAIAQEADASGREGEALDAFCASATQAWFRELLDGAGLGGDTEAASVVELDARLNAMGLAFSVRKRRYKRAKR